MRPGSSSTIGFGGRTLADIAATLPGATAVFRRHKLDFCCGGRVRLAAAAAERGLVLAELETELDAVASLCLPAGRPDDTDELIAPGRSPLSHGAPAGIAGTAAARPPG
jgi:regulator of cell morphogenesis and NO signaling